jgi:hypothetical protein
MMERSLSEEFALRRTPPKIPPTNLASFVFHHIPIKAKNKFRVNSVLTIF